MDSSGQTKAPIKVKFIWEKSKRIAVSQELISWHPFGIDLPEQSVQATVCFGLYGLYVIKYINQGAN